ncbi:MAG: DnaJ domain-containing protein [Phycisphaerales bacterium]|nr:DnaJ domain-containing protein [Phycisphaerales bacterium]
MGFKGLFRRQRDRAHPRIVREGLRSMFGQVLDISLSGVRVALEPDAEISPGDVRTFWVRGADGGLALRGRVRWLKEAKGEEPRRCGLALEGLTPALRHQLQALIEGRPAEAPALALQVEVQDLYLVLGVARDASQETMRRAYHTLARALHPDCSTSRDAADRFTLVSKAYKVLRDPDLRARYDRMLAGSVAA